MRDGGVVLIGAACLLGVVQLAAIGLTANYVAHTSNAEPGWPVALAVATTPFIGLTGVAGTALVVVGDRDLHAPAQLTLRF